MRNPCLDLGVDVGGPAAVSIVPMVCRTGTRLDSRGAVMGSGVGLAKEAG